MTKTHTQDIPATATATSTKQVRIVRHGQCLTLNDIPCDRTLLQVLREDLGDTSVKEGCAEGDCGACAVTLGQLDASGQVQYKTINSCIRLASSVDGMALWTAADLASHPDSTPSACEVALHPVQQAMVNAHATQCGFCTPGFVMSLFAAYQTQVIRQGQALSPQDAQHVLSGNLCRCTGYRSILQAATTMHQLPMQKVNETALQSHLQALHAPTLVSNTPEATANAHPNTLTDLLQARAQNPDAQVVAGCTDVGLWITKHHQRFHHILDVTRVSELALIDHDAHCVHIGAAATLTDAFAALVQDRPQLTHFVHRFAGLPVRNSGTLGGNIANGSPIGDSMPLLIALGATITLQRWDGQTVQSRTLALENFYTGYRQNLLGQDELLTHIHVPKPSQDEFCRVYKVSKRMEDDISAVCLAICMTLRDGVVASLRIGAGGVAATPARAHASEKMATHQVWTQNTAQALGLALQNEFTPIDDMRASGVYRRQILQHLVRRFWLESQGQSGTSLQDIEVNVQERAL